MEYSIKPLGHELEKARRTVENTVSKYSHAVEADDIEFYLGWQDTENPATVITETRNIITVILNPGENWEEELETELIRGLLEIEFIGKTEYDEITFNWQEVAKWAYVTAKMNTLLDEEPREYEELEGNWQELREELGEEVMEQTEFFYINSVSLGEMLGQELLESHEIDEFPELKRSDVIEAGDELFND